MTFYLFMGFIALIACQRLGEVFLSRRHEQSLLAQGGREHAPGHFIIMKLIHFGWLISMPIEVYLYNRPFLLYIFIPALTLTLAGQFLRYAAISALKERWTVRIITIPDAPPVTSGIFRYMRHPNYTGVILELAAIPLLHSAYYTCVIFSVLNLCLLAFRISKEEQALDQENNYKKYFKQPASG